MTISFRGVLKCAGVLALVVTHVFAVWGLVTQDFSGGLSAAAGVTVAICTIGGIYYAFGFMLYGIEPLISLWKRNPSITIGARCDDDKLPKAKVHR